MDRRAFFGVAGAVAGMAGAASGVAAWPAIQAIYSVEPDRCPSTVAEFNAWLRRKFNVVGSINSVPAPGAMHHAVLAAKSDEWTREAEEDVPADALRKAAEGQCVRAAALRIQSAIDLNPKAFGADLWFRRAPQVLVDSHWEVDRKFMLLRCRLVCSEELPGVTKPIYFPGALANAWRVA